MSVETSLWSLKSKGPRVFQVLRKQQCPVHQSLYSNLSLGQLFFLGFYLFLERKRNIIVWLPLWLPLLGTWPVTQACALTGNRTSDLSVHSLAPNPLSHASQGALLFFGLEYSSFPSPTSLPLKIIPMNDSLILPQIFTNLRT